ncbi:MAG: hypothetical protein H5U40_06480, partial [Polyangiaceae bacterium]|nr:hypothetical protein [Polyangiaceae bacterium]
MTEFSEPKRLREIADVPELRAALRGARDDLPTPDRVVALAAAVEAALEPPPSSPPPAVVGGRTPAGTTALAGAAGTKLVVLALVVAGAGAAIALFARDVPAGPKPARTRRRRLPSSPSRRRRSRPVTDRQRLPPRTP